MKNLKTKTFKALLFLILFSITQLATAQTSVGLRWNFGTSWLSQGTGGQKVDYKSKPQLAGMGGIYVKTMLSEKTLIGVDVLYSRTSARDVIKSYDWIPITYYYYGSLSYEIDIDNNFEFSFLNIPVYAGFLWKDWEFDMGINVQYRLSTEGMYSFQLVQYSYQQELTNNLEVDLNKFSFGIFLGADYALTDRVSFTLNYYGTLHNGTYQDFLDDFFANYYGGGDDIITHKQQRISGMFLFGLNFGLYKSKGEKEE